MAVASGTPGHGVAGRPAERGAFFGHASVVTALNPKSIAFFVAFVPQFIDNSVGILPQLVIMEMTFVGLAAVDALAFCACRRSAAHQHPPPCRAEMAEAGGRELPHWPRGGDGGSQPELAARGR